MLFKVDFIDLKGRMAEIERKGKRSSDPWAIPQMAVMAWARPIPGARNFITWDANILDSSWVHCATISAPDWVPLSCGHRGQAQVDLEKAPSPVSSMLGTCASSQSLSMSEWHTSEGGFSIFKTLAISWKQIVSL